MSGYFYFQKTDKREMPDFNVFFKYHATYPHYSDGADVYRKAADLLAAEGVIEAADYPAADYDGYKPATSDFIDGIEYDGKKPISYINAHKIGNKDDIALEAK